MKVYYTANESGTLSIAAALARTLSAGDIVLLRGDLGAGKSVFARGVARGWGVSGHITSPTFTTMQQYECARGHFYHFDLYRLDDPEQLFESGLNEFIGGDGLAVIEWPENAELDPADAWTVYVERIEPCDIPEGKVYQPTDAPAEEALCDGYARRITILSPGEELA